MNRFIFITLFGMIGSASAYADNGSCEAQLYMAKTLTDLNSTGQFPIDQNGELKVGNCRIKTSTEFESRHPYGSVWVQNILVFQPPLSTEHLVQLVNQKFIDALEKCACGTI